MYIVETRSLNILNTKIPSSKWGCYCLQVSYINPCSIPYVCNISWRSMMQPYFFRKSAPSRQLWARSLATRTGWCTTSVPTVSSTSVSPKRVISSPLAVTTGCAGGLRSLVSRCFSRYPLVQCRRRSLYQQALKWVAH